MSVDTLYRAISALRPIAHLEQVAPPAVLHRRNISKVNCSADRPVKSVSDMPSAFLARLMLCGLDGTCSRRRFAAHAKKGCFR